MNSLNSWKDSSPITGHCGTVAPESLVSGFGLGTLPAVFRARGTTPSFCCGRRIGFLADFVGEDMTGVGSWREMSGGLGQAAATEGISAAFRFAPAFLGVGGDTSWAGEKSLGAAFSRSPPSLPHLGNSESFFPHGCHVRQLAEMFSGMSETRLFSVDRTPLIQG